jgi:hypothetical protein
MKPKFFSQISDGDYPRKDLFAIFMIQDSANRGHYTGTTRSFILNESKVELSLDLTSMLKKKIYSINYRKIAPEKRLLLIDQLSQTMLDHARFFGGYCSQWLKEENNYKLENITKE